MEIAGKTALVTGAAQRVGRQIALALARAGANIVINYQSSQEQALSTVAEVEAFGRQAAAIKADVSNLSEVQQLVERAAARFGQVDILVNNASLFKTSPVPTTDFSAWKQVTSILLDGAFYLSNLVAPGMLAQGAGCIVNIVDLSAFQAWRHFTAHAVGKSGLLALTRQLAIELAPSVRVNAVAPGNVLPPPDYDQEQIERSMRKTPLKRWGTPEDVAQAVLYLIQADYVTGECICVDGGERFGS